MATTYNAAKKLVEQRASQKYRGTTLLTLQKLVSLTYAYSPKDKPNYYNENVEDRDVVKKWATLWRGIPIKERQRQRTLSQLVADGLLVYQREGKNICYRLVLQSLKELPEPDISSAERMQKELSKVRTAKAREERGRNRFQFTEFFALLWAATVSGGFLPPETLDCIAP